MKKSNPYTVKHPKVKSSKQEVKLPKGLKASKEYSVSTKK